jgi:T5SS/PEP-CTERM-associated repeat protein
LIVGLHDAATLDISNGSIVDNSFESYIGRLAGSDGTVTVRDTGSLFNVSSDLAVGYEGTGRLVIENGALVSVGRRTMLGYRGGTGTLTLDGGTLDTGGFLSPIDALLGTGTVNTGGIVSDLDLVFDATTSLQQQVLLNSLPGQNVTLNIDVTKANAVAMGAGYAGAGSLTIADGVQIQNRRGFIGYLAGSNGSVNVAGAGSQWTNASLLEIGTGGAGSLTISDGGLVNAQAIYAGKEAGGTGEILVTGSGSVLNVSAEVQLGFEGSGAMRIEDGGMVDVDVRTLLTPGLGSLNLDNGTLKTGGLFAAAQAITGTGTIQAASIVSDMDFVFDATNGLQQQWVLDALPGQNVLIDLDASVAENNRDMGAGLAGFGSLTIADGVVLKSDKGFLGYNAGSQGTGTVTGAGSQWHATKHLYIGSSGAGTLRIEDGGEVFAESLTLAEYAGATSDVTVTGVGSQMTAYDSFFIGKHADATLRILDGGSVVVRDGGSDVLAQTRVAYAAGVSGTIRVDGSGSRFVIEETRNDFNLGDVGTGQLIITNGGSATISSDSFFANAADSMADVRIDGPGSRLHLERRADFGVAGHATVDVSAGAELSTRSGFLLGITADSSGTLNVSGPNTRMNVSGGINLGIAGAASLNIDQAAIATLGTNLVIGSSTGANASVMLQGVGSQLVVAHDITIARGNDTTAVFEVLDSGYVGSEAASIGNGYNASGTAIVSGSGSLWNIERDLTLARNSGGTLRIEDGAVVNARGLTSTYYTTNTGSFETFATIHLDNGTLNTGGILASANRLRGNGTINTYGFVADADLVFDAPGLTTASIVYDTLPDQNVTINLDTVRSLDYPVSTFLGVGYTEAGSLTIENGSAIESVYGHLGYRSGATGTAVVRGSNSQWNVLNTLKFGERGEGKLDILDGASVTGTDVYIGDQAGSTGSVLLEGSNSHWRLYGVLRVGHHGEGSLTIRDGVTLFNREQSTYPGADYTRIGDAAGSGTITVQGQGSKLTTPYLQVGRGAAGQLNILDGGVVNADVQAATIHQGQVRGAIFFDDGTLNTDTLIAPGSTHSGVGTIHTVSYLTDVDMFFSGTGLGQGILERTPGERIVINVDASTPGNGSQDITAGYIESGSISIENGAEVFSRQGYAGLQARSHGVITVTGSGSHWYTTGSIYVGLLGTGALNLRDRYTQKSICQRSQRD